MNYSKVLCSTKKQFDATMNRERIVVTDFFDSNITYEVFFRRNNRGTNPDGKLKLYYAKETPIHVGTIFVLKGEIYIVNSKDGIESDIFFTSMAVKCDVTFVVNSNGEYKDIPFTVVSDKFTVNHGTISAVDGTVIMYTQDKSHCKALKHNHNRNGRCDATPYKPGYFPYIQQCIVPYRQSKDRSACRRRKLSASLCEIIWGRGRQYRRGGRLQHI